MYKCTKTIEAMKKSPLRLIKHLCCNNDHDIGNSVCCSNPDCEVAKVERSLNTNLMKMHPDCTIGFKQIVIVPKAVTNGKTRNCHATMYEEYN